MTTAQTDSYEILYARQSEHLATLEESNKDLLTQIDRKNEQIRALSHQVITLKNQLHGLFDGSITLTQALAAAETPVAIEIS